MTTNERQILVDLIEKLEKHAHEKFEMSRNERLSDTMRDRADAAYWYLTVCAGEVQNALNKIDRLSEND